MGYLFAEGCFYTYFPNEYKSEVNDMFVYMQLMRIYMLLLFTDTSITIISQHLFQCYLCKLIT